MLFQIAHSHRQPDCLSREKPPRGTEHVRIAVDGSGRQWNIGRYHEIVVL